VSNKDRDQSKSFAADIECVADGEAIIGICIGAFGWGTLYTEEELKKHPHLSNDDLGYKEVHCPSQIPMEKRGKVLSWEEARPLLDYGYDTGYGAPGCHAITAWTENKIITVVQYDGSTHLVSDLRNPHDHIPGMAGG
jgi:hypothetical protein